VLEGCYDEKIEERKEYLTGLMVVLVLACREEIKTDGVKIFLSRLNRKLNRELFDTKPLSSSDFLKTKEFFDVKPLSSFSFPKLLKLGNNTEQSSKGELFFL
jgi:hypothetical protein